MRPFQVERNTHISLAGRTSGSGRMSLSDHLLLSWILPRCCPAVRVLYSHTHTLRYRAERTESGTADNPCKHGCETGDSERVRVAVGEVPKKTHMIVPFSESHVIPCQLQTDPVPQPSLVIHAGPHRSRKKPIRARSTSGSGCEALAVPARANHEHHGG